MNYRNCKIQGHTQKKVEYLCMYINCDQKERRMCDECRYDKKHNHLIRNN